ncbi:MAG: DUF1343 domain-containing protein [Thermodesulfobacteriota bacterium]|nr:DUF1343 domain-containing protein [Thermodesulfobacteriota bacterium]
MRTKTGIQVLCESPGTVPMGKRLGLLANPASVDARFRHSRGLINECFPGRLTALYSPQHGFFAEKQDNMIESADAVDPDLGLPIFSLYGETRIPTATMLDPIDTLIIDIQDVGTRVYTFIYTMAHCMEAARQYGKQVVVLDRPNPINGSIVEGNILALENASFVGRYPIPMRHGLTIGELARLFNDHFGIGCALSVVPMQGWHRHMYFSDTGLPWVPPSPNLPTPSAAMVYPGQVLWEGTNVSEGRGTTTPFEVFGAPFVDNRGILDYFGSAQPAGIVARPVVFEPTANKWTGTPCQGFHIHVTDSNKYRPYAATLAFMQAIIALHGDRFEWKPPPYEYEYEKLPIDLIIGDTHIRKQMTALEPLGSIIERWQPGLAAFDELRKEYYLYRCCEA